MQESGMTEKEKHSGLGIALGAALGVAFGVIAGNIGVWLAIGVAIGLALGSAFRRKQPQCPHCAELQHTHQAMQKRPL
jgi:drug/metabolite transporter (DMT)-like permease